MRESSDLVLFIVTLILLVRLVTTGLLRRYPVFGVLIAVAATLTGALWYVTSQNLYGWIFFCGFPLTWLLTSASGVEVLTRILQHHQGIRRLGRNVMLTGMAAGLLLSVWALAARTTVNLHSQYLIGLRMQLFLDCALILFWLGSTLFITWFPLSLSRNIFRHCLIFTLLCAGQLIGDILLVFATERWFGYARVVSAWVAILAYLLWILALTHHGEDTKGSVRRPPPEEERRLLAKLDEIDSHLRASPVGAGRE